MDHEYWSCVETLLVGQIEVIRGITKSLSYKINTLEERLKKNKVFENEYQTMAPKEELESLRRAKKTRKVWARNRIDVTA